MPTADPLRGPAPDPQPTASEPAGRTWQQWQRETMVNGPEWARDYFYVMQRQLRGPWEQVAPPQFQQGERAPVVLIAGVLEPWTLLLPVALRLNAEGHPIHVVPELAVNTMSVTKAADLVGRSLRERDLRGVVLVAHSKGGLIGKRMLLDDTDGRITRLVAIATPWHGSSLARWVPGRVIRSLRPGDSAIAALTANAEVNAKITSVYPRLDQHVPEGSYLPGATNVELPTMGHFRVLGAPATLDAVVAALR